MTLLHRLSVLACLACSGRATALAADVAPAHVLVPDKRSPGERLPLLLYLHGLGGSGADAIRDPAVANLARRARMIVVAPDGDVDSQGRRFWNAGAACCNFDRAPVDDVARLTALIDDWRKRPEIDPRRIYVLGFSNGGFMAHLLGCRISDRLTAVVSIAGAGTDPKLPCAPASALAVLEIHGDADRIVHYQGGRVFDSAQLAPHPSAPQTIRGWAQRLGCGSRAPQKEPRGSQIAVEATRGCALGSATLWTVRGEGHHLETPEVLDQVAAFLALQSKPLPKRK